MYSSNIILQTVYEISREDKGLSNWVKITKVLLFQFGFDHVWLNPYSVEPDTFISAFKLRLIDSFQQTWRNDVESNNKLHLYNNFKCEFNYEPYLNIVCDRTLRQLLTKVRLSSHALRIETARYGRHRIDRAERLCLFCDLRQLDDEFHFICQCPLVHDIRIKYIKTRYIRQPSVYKLCELLKTSNKTTLINLCKFIKEAFERRLTGNIHAYLCFFIYTFILILPWTDNSQCPFQEVEIYHYPYFVHIKTELVDSTPHIQINHG